MPHHALDVRSRDDAALAERLTRLRDELELPGRFPEEVLREAERAAQRVPAAVASGPAWADRTDVPFVTVDPAGSTDLDQALHLEQGPGERRITVRYAIADVPAFVAPEGAVDAEARRRGQTVYLPDGRVPLHPPVLSEDAASLLPGVDRPAFVWTFLLDADGTVLETGLERARVRSRRQLSYPEVQAFLDDPQSPAAADWPEPVRACLALLPEVGRRRAAQEAARGGASLTMPDQEVHVEDGRYRIVHRVPLPAEDHNAQLSLMTGMAAAAVMLEAGVGVLRTMPAPDEEAVAAFRARTHALGLPWEEGVDYGTYLRGVDPSDPRGLAVMHAATSLFRGAGYTVFDTASEDEALRTPPEDPRQAALAAPYTHATAPLRRLVDRFVLALCHAVVTGAEVPGWVRSALPELPALMADSGRRASAADSAATDLVEAAALADRVGEVLEGTVVRARENAVEVQVADPAVALTVPGRAEAGAVVRVRVDAVDVASGSVTVSGVDWPHSIR
ncbi:ribonuclease catalytic domain-containing protein [Micrococcus sp.]|uniref:ribonuclease catalytic domain-containing protein n=1 Tax=Micrococcus sp. TaxID=1271 RepID=UPI002A91ABD8|nr:RNB domain-containing ribonuclease [Micrococcus sp.]MDY6054570.1 RNB domain-containing ribonuclease [Micrococcus sp.]